MFGTNFDYIVERIGLRAKLDNFNRFHIKNIELCS